MVNHHELTETSFIPEETINAQELNLSTEESPKEESLRNVEEEKGRRFEVIVLPRIAEDNAGNAYLRRAEQDRENLARLEKIANFFRQIPQDKLKADSIETINYIINLYERYKNRLPGIRNSQEVRELTSAKIKTHYKLSDKEIAPAAEMQEELKQGFKNTSADTISLAESHMATMYSIQAAQEVAEERNPNIAVVVFDNHQDIYGPEYDKHVWKGNIFRLLAEKGIIKGAAFFKDFSQPGSVYYGGGKSRTMQDNIDPNLGHQERAREIITQVLRDLATNGVKNILISIDIDLLRAGDIGYTAMEYNPGTSLGYLSSLNPAYLGNPKEFSKSDVEIILRRLTYLGTPEKENPWGRPPALTTDGTFDPRGVKLSEVGRALETIYAEAKHLGIEIGLDLQGGGKYIGDIVELSGYDYMGHTTRAVAALARKIENLASQARKDGEN